MHITILVGTVNGNAQSVAEALQFCADDIGATIDVLPMDGLDITVFDTSGTFIICTSTTGAGDVPGNAVGLLNSLDAQAKYLGHVRYGLVALGDSSYGDSFLGGGKQFDAKLQDLGARKMGDICVLDAMETMTPEDDAVVWLQSWAVEWATLK
ncbi:MAG: flavodoxin domain-containing protein [Rhodoferax sp.]|uniref:flavodoxin domain-containing protein n=1 Tax=Rhodoferax sp. TaxID=50421 RepID=UPI002ACD6201|nr:flavodoxin domain-containing protein [Rhodoferax sp.]MDZ7892159.1 flavodoxin domain-containing protein [Rhodoferax sp.]